RRAAITFSAASSASVTRSSAEVFWRTAPAVRWRKRGRISASAASRRIAATVLASAVVKLISVSGQASGGDAGLFERGNACGEIVEERDQAWMRRPPASGKAEVEIAERAGERDVADMKRTVQGERFGGGEAALDLACLMRLPLRALLLRLAPAAFIDLEQRRVGDAVGERLHDERRIVPRRVGGDDPPAAGEMVEI